MVTDPPAQRVKKKREIAYAITPCEGGGGRGFSTPRTGGVSLRLVTLKG